MATTSILASEVTLALDEYFQQVDRALPGTLQGFYLVGSIALDDYVSALSDVDFVAVSSEPLTELEIQALTEIHRRLTRTDGLPTFDGIYTTWATLSNSPGDASAHHWLDTTMQRDSRYGANPVTWATLRKHLVVVRGSPAPEVFHSDTELREWCQVNLRSYWASWVRSSRKIGTRFFASFTLKAVSWGVLGVVRLHATIKTGEIISKTQAFHYGREVFPDEWHAVLQLALSGRAEVQRPKMGIFERRSRALRFMENAITDASSPSSHQN